MRTSLRLLERNPTITTRRRTVVVFGSRRRRRRDCIRRTTTTSSFLPWNWRTTARISLNSIYHHPPVLLSSSSNDHAIKLSSRTCISCCSLSSSLDYYSCSINNHNHSLLFHALLTISQPTPHLLVLLLPPLLAAILYYTTNNNTNSYNIFSSNYKYKFEIENDIMGEWSLCTSPTPFYRFLKLRCASLPPPTTTTEGKEDSDTGPIPHQSQQQQAQAEAISYQRICINAANDGGVISLDWPSALDLEDLNNGLDTTVLIVPGMNTLGSTDVHVLSLVSLFLKQGCFPLVMNPRGCARSPLTTPRLFTPADTDDISTTIRFINRARSCTTLMAVALGYGANMLTKYLALVGDDTPLTSAVCLDNPFHLKHPALHHPSLDHHLTNGFIHILQRNKELFQGRSKKFDVEKALRSKSVKDFEEAISMVSYGFTSIEDFYVSSSTTDVIGSIMIPVLFVQNGALSSSFIPRSSIAKNPFTSLLVCTFRSDDKSTIGTSAVSWCQHLVVEWLIAVEVGLLKGRHPLVEDAVVTINPSKQLKVMATEVSHASSKSGNLPNPYQLDALEGDSSYAGKRSSLDLQRYKVKKEINADTTVMETQTNLEDSEGDAVVDSERGEALQATEVVMKMLDVTMPNTLSEEQKHKVLTAVGQGETLMNALQVAVPEDVRGKLTSTVSAILQNQKKNLNAFSSNIHAPDVTSAVNTKIQEPIISNQDKESSTFELNKGGTNLGDSVKPEEDSIQSTSDHGGEISGLNNGDLGANESDEVSKEKADQTAHLHDSELNHLPHISSKAEVSSQDSICEQVKLGNKDETKVNNDNQQKDAEPSTDEKSVSTPRTEETSSPSASSADKPLMAKEDVEDQKKEESSVQPVTSNSPSTFNVTQALDALTGMDDSTQVAVNSVFSVIEDVITQLEGSRDDESATADKNKVEDVYQKHHIESKSDLQQIGDGKSNMTIEPKELCNHQQSLTISNPPTEKIYEATVFDNNHNVIQSRLLSNMKHDRSLDLDATTDLCLDYVPEEGKFKLLEQSRDGSSFVDDATSHDGPEINIENPLLADVDCNSDIIEPSYVILDAEGDGEAIGGYKKIGETNENLGIGNDASVQLMKLVRENILSSLKVQVCRRIQSDDMVDMAPVLKKELEQVASTISLAAVHDKQHLIAWEGEDFDGPDNQQAEHMLEVISSAVEGTRYMKQVIPVGIVVGSSLASLRKVFNISAADSIGSTEVEIDQIKSSKKGYYLQAGRTFDEEMHHDKVNQNKNLGSEDEEYDEKDLSDSLRNDTVMVGAVTAALGASALLVNQQGPYSEGLESSTTSSMFFNQKKKDQEPGKLQEETSKSSDHNVVTSLAEKAMLVASPVVPTKEGWLHCWQIWGKKVAS
uniref:uncharacterized protein LOC122598278 isoform X2 n=1 Tax=Erigeron canadensis TaxID=72917 RepID=UPI001CB8A4FA|nr:uncharacterized protein LOC122598278 isoform X2 [Erigeron canadensis]